MKYILDTNLFLFLLLTLYIINIFKLLLIFFKDDLVLLIFLYSIYLYLNSRVLLLLIISILYYLN